MSDDRDMPMGGFVYGVALGTALWAVIVIAAWLHYQ